MRAAYTNEIRYDCDQHQIRWTFLDRRVEFNEYGYGSPPVYDVVCAVVMTRPTFEAYMAILKEMEARLPPAAASMHEPAPAPAGELVSYTPDDYLDDKKLLAELNDRIEAAPGNAKPVFAGIAGLHARVAAYEQRMGIRS